MSHGQMLAFFFLYSKYEIKYNKKFILVKCISECLEEFDYSDTLLPRLNKEHFWCEVKRAVISFRDGLNSWQDFVISTFFDPAHLKSK